MGKGHIHQMFTAKTSRDSHLVETVNLCYFDIYQSAEWCRCVVVIATAQLYSTKSELRFCTDTRISDNFPR